jgi:flagellar basal-body rod modification protein FlgD
MTVAPTTLTPATKPDATALGRTSLAENFNTFLSLLTTQLKNQDPTAPLDSNQFTQQLVQMTGVEQQLNANDLLKQVVANTSSGLTSAVSLIGKEVKATSNTASISGGQAKWTYNLPADAADVRIEIDDSSGKPVYLAAPSNNKAGDHALAWNGKDLIGNQLPDGGTYTLRVTASDASGAAVNATNYVQGVVTGVEQSGGNTYLTVNGGKVTWDKVTSINMPAAPAATTTSTATNGASTPQAGA